MSLFEPSDAYSIRKLQHWFSAWAWLSGLCLCVAETSGQAIASFIQGVRQKSTDDSTPPGETLLCLFHWQQAHELCACNPEKLVLHERLLQRQQKSLTQLDSTVEAYLARFNAAKRERGEVPDIPEAA